MINQLQNGKQNSKIKTKLHLNWVTIKILQNMLSHYFCQQLDAKVS